MKSFVYHFQINVSNDKAVKFYRDMFEYLEYQFLIEEDWGFGTTNDKTDIWIVKSEAKYQVNKYHRKSVGLNHLCLGVGSKEDVDRFTEEFLKPRKLNVLYGSPKEYPEYTKGYYAVFFEDPDRIKLEITFIPGFEDKI